MTSQEGRGGRCKRSERPSGPTSQAPGYRLPRDVRDALDRAALRALWDDVTVGMSDDEKAAILRGLAVQP